MLTLWTRLYVSCITLTFGEVLKTSYKHIYFITKERGAIEIFSCPIQELLYLSYIVHSFTQYNTYRCQQKVLLHFKTNQGKRVFITQKKKIITTITKFANYKRGRILVAGLDTFRSKFVHRAVASNVYSKSTTTHETHRKP